MSSVGVYLTSLYERACVWTKDDAARALKHYLTSRGGSVRTDQLRQFYTSTPWFKKAVGSTLAEFLGGRKEFAYDRHAWDYALVSLVDDSEFMVDIGEDAEKENQQGY